MPKKVKLDLKDLNVESFKTSEKEPKKIVGGGSMGCTWAYTDCWKTEPRFMCF